MDRRDCAVSADVAIPQIGARPVAATGPAPQAAAPALQTADTGGGVATASKRPLFNPSLHVDVALNLVVLQFVDDNGDVTNSIPSPKQLKAYREHLPDPAAAAKK